MQTTMPPPQPAPAGDALEAPHFARSLTLLDVFCLGVKNAFTRSVSEGEYRSLVQHITRGFVEKMLTYAVGRGMEAFDKCTIDKIAESLARNNYRFSALVIDIVKSDPFEMRRGRTVSRKPDDKPPAKGDPKVQPKGNK